MLSSRGFTIHADPVTTTKVLAAGETHKLKHGPPDKRMSSGSCPLSEASNSSPVVGIHNVRTAGS